METVQSIREENALGGRNTQQWLVDVIKMAAELDKMAAVREKAALVLSLKRFPTKKNCNKTVRSMREQTKQNV